MTLIKTSILSGIATVIKVITGFILNKIIAVYIGPSGLAYIGQFQNFIQFVMNFATSAISSGVVKYTAEYRDDLIEKRKLWSTAILISSVSTLIIAICLLIFNKYLSLYFFKTAEFSSIFFVFGLTLIFFVLNNMLLSILNGEGEILKLTSSNIISNVVTLLLVSLLSIYYGLYGALLSLTIGQSVVFFVTFFLIARSHWFKIKYFFNKYDNNFLIKLFKYALMAIIAGITGPISQMIIRDYIGENLSWENAGCWEGVTRISSTYLMMVTTTLSVYYLPKISSLKKRDDIRKEIINGYKIIIPIVIAGAVSIYFFRDYAITLLFTKEFSKMADLFAFQLIGDVLKISSWLLSYIMVAKAMLKMFIITEIIFSSTLVIFSIIFIISFGLVGVTYAYSLNYLLYLFSLYSLLKNRAI